MRASGIFCRHRFLSSPNTGFGLGWFSTASFQSLGPWLKASRLPGTLARHISPNRVHFRVLAEPLRYGLAFRFQLLSTVGLSPPQFLSTTGWLTSA